MSWTSVSPSPVPLPSLYRYSLVICACPALADWEGKRCDRDRYRIESFVIESLLAYVTMVAGLWVQSDHALDFQTQVVVYTSKFLRVAASMYYESGPYKVSTLSTLFVYLPLFVPFVPSLYHTDQCHPCRVCSQGRLDPQRFQPGPRTPEGKSCPGPGSSGGADLSPR